MYRIIVSVTILYMCLHQVHVSPITADEGLRKADTSFDVIVFAQEWPTTLCKDWVLHTGGECDFPKKEHLWNIHGIWPRQQGVQYIENCNKSWHFEREQVKPLVTELDEVFINVFKERPENSFWEHEWVKHGTCSAELDTLDSQFKYFSKAIELSYLYPISDMLQAAEIFPSDTKVWDPEVFVNAIKAVTNKTSMLGCYRIEGVVYVQEIRICFDKEFNVIDCESPAVDKMCLKPSKLNGVIYPAHP